MMIWLVLAVFFDRASLGRWSHDKRFFRQFGQLQAKELLLVRVSQPHDISPWLSDGLIVVYHGLSWEKSRYVTGSNSESHLPGITTISTHPGLSDLMPETEKIWEPHLQSVRAPKSNFHSDFQMARRLLEDHLPRIRNELEVRHKKLPAPKCEGAFCEQILFKKFDTFASNVSSSTCILPQLCRTLQEVETQHGLHVLASSMVEAHDPTAPVTQFPGRLRLWCAMMHFLDSCFWLDEGVSLKISSSSSPHFFVVDFRGPTYEETDLDGDTFHSLLWLQSLLTHPWWCFKLYWSFGSEASQISGAGKLGNERDVYVCTLCIQLQRFHWFQANKTDFHLWSSVKSVKHRTVSALEKKGYDWDGHWDVLLLDHPLGKPTLHGKARWWVKRLKRKELM